MTVPDPKKTALPRSESGIAQQIERNGAFARILLRSDDILAPDPAWN
jgi:hypothetical protein